MVSEGTMKEFLLGIPSYGGEIRIELVSFLMESAPYCDFLPVVHRSTDVARNIIIMTAQARKKHVIMVDADSVPSPGMCKVFVEKILSEECMVCAPYVSSNNHICVTNGMKEVNGCIVDNMPISTKEMETLSGWTKVANCGTHNVGYNYKVFDKIEKPYFEYEYDACRTWAMSEDYVCHRKLRAAGVSIYCNWDYWSKHIVSKVMDRPHTLTAFEKQIFLESE